MCSGDEKNFVKTNLKFSYSVRKSYSDKYHMVFTGFFLNVVF